jgi:hypothetical protein
MIVCAGYRDTTKYRSAPSPWRRACLSPSVVAGETLPIQFESLGSQAADSGFRHEALNFYQFTAPEGRKRGAAAGFADYGASPGGKR